MSRLGAIESTTVARSAVSTSASEAMNSRVKRRLELPGLDAELPGLVADVGVLQRHARPAGAHRPGAKFPLHPPGHILRRAPEGREPGPVEWSH